MQSVVDQIGGETALRDLVETFYDLMESEPRGKNLRHLHFLGTGFANARMEQFNFLSGFLGGRQHYREKHGHMDIKLIHEHVSITNEDAEDWLFLMEQTLEQCDIQASLKDRMMGPFRRVAMVLVNDGVVCGV